jgi:coproporphyrinogen III oxidase-like Fe-S oxidoreductase
LPMDRLDAVELERAETAVADGLLIADGDSLILTDRGRLLADGVVRSLLG